LTRKPIIERLLVEQRWVAGVTCTDKLEGKADLVLVSGGAQVFLDFLGPENVPAPLA
jgi:hypothetical protein